MTDHRAPHGGRKRLAARDYASMPCRCRQFKNGVCDACFSIMAYDAEVEERAALGVMIGYASGPLVFPQPINPVVGPAKALLARISVAAAATAESAGDVAHADFHEALQLNARGDAANKRDLTK